MEKDFIINRLEEISKDVSRSELEKHTAHILLINLFDEEQIAEWFSRFWRKQDNIPELYFYKDTYMFYDLHSNDINKLLEEEIDNGLEVEIDWFSKKDLAWFGFEQKLSDLQLEVMRGVKNGN